MITESFVAYIQCDKIESYRVAIGSCKILENIEFILIEFTDLGQIIRYIDSKNESVKELFNEFISLNSDKEHKKNIKFFIGNNKFKKLLKSYKEMGSDFVHNTNCDCLACSNCKFTIYRGNTIERVIKDFSDI